MNRQRLTDSLVYHEGMEERPYKDTRGYFTIGIGRCLETNPLTASEYKFLLNGAHLFMTLTESGARWLVDREIDSIIRELASELEFWSGLSAVAQETLIEMAYQLGTGNLLRFRDMLASLAKHDYKAAAVAGLDSQWSRQTPQRAKELMQRLEAA